MQTRRVLCLTEAITFDQPTSWETHARYALQRGAGEVQVPAGAWLLELEPVETWPDQQCEYRYRTPSGQVVALGSPLEGDRYREVSDPQVVTALNAYRSLADILRQDFGLALQQTCPGLPPFALIKCPLCSGTSFTTVDLASAWCDRCNASFHVRSTAGDPGFVVDLTWGHYDPLAAHYVLPRTDKLLATLVLKDSGDPRDMRRDHCTEACRSGPIQLTDGSNGLRPGLHRCQIGTLYDWRSIYGRVPTPGDLRRETNWEIDGQLWPAGAALRTLRLKQVERRALELAAELFTKELTGTARELHELLSLRAQPPTVHEAVLPDVRKLQQEERYLLHHWLTLTPDGPDHSYELALPVWYVVAPLVAAHRLTGWRVVRRDLCPRCGERVAPEDIAAGADGRRWDLPHGYCREIWEKTGWHPPDHEGKSGGEPDETDQPGGKR